MEDTTHIYGTNTKGSELREVKVKIPLRQVVALHGMKILKGDNVSDIVALALDRYLESGKQLGADAITAGTADTLPLRPEA